MQKAKKILAEYNPIVIGITGSYGKTSTKHILAHVLSYIAPTLATPGSINTPMGITRIIREKLKPEHKFFIVEMGAYGKGSIERICNFTNPTYGIITAIGHAHFERFKSIENVAQTKFELLQAVKNKSGFIIINGDAIEQKFINQYCNEKTIQVKSNSTDSNIAYKISDVKQNILGINFTITFNNFSYSVSSPLYGLHHVENVALCFALAHKMGLSPETIVAALHCTPQIQHRLEIIKEKGKPIIIDDAYNSNPTGFSAALDILKIFKDNGYRSILVTPGIVELGEIHDEKHFQLGEQAAGIADYALVIIPTRIKAFIDGFKNKANPEQKLLTFSSFDEVKNWLAYNASNKDVILFENDLPDLYESVVKL